MVKLNVKKYTTIIAVIALLIFLHYAKILSPLELYLNQGLRPIYKIFYSVSSNIKQTYQSQTDKTDLASELNQARETINRLMAENVELRFLEKENQVLREQLNFLSKNNRRYVMANIISRGDLENGAKNSQAVVIDKGLKDGLSPGLAVVSASSLATSSRGVIIGKISNVKDDISEIRLVTDEKCKLAAAILGDNKTIGVTSGELGLTIKMDFIPQTENIKAGDLAATSGLEQNIPRGLLIGRVVKVDKENNQVWQSAIIEPQIGLDSLSVVSVLLP
ncbi:MAG: rod shape-determining protein MreC [Patescibacteria group bacterium]|nr:rod shape-determining protein MreC [Patescibacteria group bacterium]